MRNVLLVTMDQLRADMIGHPLVETPALDALRAEGVHFTRHYSQAAPCAPGRAALYTGTYQMNNRVVANGTPLDDRLDNVARLARRAGYVPALFGYTDQGLDPRTTDPSDERLDTYSGILDGFEPTFWLPEDQSPWLRWLEALGYGPRSDYITELSNEPSRPEEHSISAFLTDGFLEWLVQQQEPWFAHLSYLRPHPPYAAAGSYAERYRPEDCGSGIEPMDTPHPLHAAAMELEVTAAPATKREREALRAQYFGMVTEVDAQFGRVIEELKESGAWGETLVVLTADHGDQLCDQGLIEKLGFFEQSYHVPLVIHDPSSPSQFGATIEQFTENVDVLPTIAAALDQPIPAQCDGLPLQGFLSGSEPRWWRSSAHYEWDWRYLFIDATSDRWPLDRFLERQNLAVVRDERGAYVHFGDGTWLLFDLAEDPTWRTTTDDPARVLPYAQEMLSWRQEHLDRTLTDLLLTPERPGRWPSAL